VCPNIIYKEEPKDSTFEIQKIIKPSSNLEEKIN